VRRGANPGTERKDQEIEEKGAPGGEKIHTKRPAPEKLGRWSKMEKMHAGGLTAAEKRRYSLSREKS